MSDINPSYWQGYSNLQHTKHKLIREYLNGWFPKLGSGSGKILYIDTHAGKGRHERGQEGSPLVALKTFLAHSWRDKILENCEVNFIFIEADERNEECLQNELKEIGNLPNGTSYRTYNIDAFDFLKDLTDFLEKEDMKLSPCFIFVDPYGFKIPCETLRKLKAHPRSELLITFIWRELDMAMQQEQPPEETLNSVFGGGDWRNIRSIADSDERGEAAVKLLRENIGARYVTYIRMLADNQTTRYFLVHLTDHKEGRDLMKEVVWKCCPDGGYYVRKRDDPRQQYLIKPEPDLQPLQSWLIDNLRRQDYTWDQLEQMLRQEVWLKKHLWLVIRELKASNRVRASNYAGKFSQKTNPTFKLSNV